MKALDQLNIDNLTSLWRTMGVENHSEFATDGLNISHTWPNRFWFEWSATSAQIAKLNYCLHRLPVRAVIPVWTGAGVQAAELEKLLLAAGYEILFSQLAMYLDLRSVQVAPVPELDIVTPDTPAVVEIWSATASAAFGYEIDSAAIHALLGVPEVKLLLLNRTGQAAATALVYKTGDVFGVHLVGVTNSYRGQGIARAMMHYVIQYCISMGGQYLTLQASAAGEPLYRELGFVEQFVIKNYQRKNN